MDPNTGKIYRGAEEINKARQAGLTIVDVSEEVAETMELGQAVKKAIKRQQRLLQARLHAKLNRPK